MTAPAVATSSAPGCDSLCRIRRLDVDERLIQEGLRQRERIAAGGGGLNSIACRNHSAAGLADPDAERGGFFLPKKGIPRSPRYRERSLWQPALVVERLLQGKRQRQAVVAPRG